METEWAEGRPKIPESGVRGILSRSLGQSNATSERDKYRIRLDRTPDGKGTEIYISHRGMEEIYTTREPTSSTPGQTAWQPRNPDPELEAAYLRRLMVRLGTNDEKARALAAANAVTAPAAAEGDPSQRAQITKTVNGAEQLEVSEPFDRVWRRVGLALDRVGFTVEDRDRQKGIYFVRYADPEVEKDTRGLLTRWFSSDSKVKAQQYRVQITQAGAASQVNVLNVLTHGTLRALRAAGKMHDGVRTLFLRSGERAPIGGMEVLPFTVPHDAAEPVQFVLSDGAAKLGVVTDIGIGTRHVEQMLSGLDALVLECNYDRDMLWSGAYPRWLKERIGGPFGHLDNRDAARLLASLDRSRLKHIIGAHLSQQNNTPALARAVLAQALGCSEEWIGIASQDDGFDWREA